MTSPRPRPDLAPDQGATSGFDLAPRPHPRSGARSNWSPNATTTQTTPTSPQGRGQRPGSRWLITNHTRPAWQAARDLLADGQWHPTTELITTMRAHGLAKRTVANHLPSAAARGWIRRKAGQVKLRDRQALDDALVGVTS